MVFKEGLDLHQDDICKSFIAPKKANELATKGHHPGRIKRKIAAGRNTIAIKADNIFPSQFSNSHILDYKFT